jgi:SAM-dependent methyltransferase
MKAKRGVVVEVGARAVSPGQVLQADQFAPECKFIGVDIHAAPGVDIVADAHFLSDYLPKGSVDGLFSQAVMEHLAFPWLFAGEINKVLRVGGLTLHVAPQAYPLHELPNDFWRMSDHGMRLLFSKETGFEVLASGMCGPVKMIAHPLERQHGHLETALFDGMLTSWIFARKVADISDDAIKWPVAKASSFERGRDYPSHQPAEPAPASVAESAEPVAFPDPVADPAEPVAFDDGGTTIAIRCPACGAAGEKKRLLTALGLHSLYGCAACGSSFYHPFPKLDYEQHTPELLMRDYVEMGASIEFPAANVLRLIPEGRKGRMLDVGCGFGFALDLARTLAGWEVKGFEPSQYGAAGRKQLGLDIIPAFATRNEGGPLYDIVYCSEVIEHIYDPEAFIGILTSYLKDDGILVITSPNPDAIRREKSTSRLLSLLSPGAHTILFSDRAIAALLRAAGLAHMRVTSGETTLYYASRSPFDFARRDIGPDLLMQYYGAVLRRATPSSPLEIGLRYRLFRAAMDYGQYDIAASAYTSDLTQLAPRLDDIDSIDDFAARWPFCIAASTYYSGMFQLLSAKNHRLAASHFEAAFALCQKKIALAPQTSSVEADLVWRSIYHEALAYAWAGDLDQAAHAIRPLLAPVLDPPLPANLRGDVDKLTARLNVFA